MPSMNAASGGGRGRRFQPDHERWSQRLEELRQYKTQHSDTNVPQRYKHNPILGQWVANQRAQYKKMQAGKSSRMTPARVAALNELGFAWRIIKTPRTELWEEKLELLRRYKAHHGDANVPQRHPPNPALGIWVATQRAEYRKMQQNKPSFLTKEKVAALEEIGLVWRIDKYCQKATWDEHLEELRQYKATHDGNVNVPQKDPQHRTLGMWVTNQRSEYRKLQRSQPSTMTPSRVAALEAIGFTWKIDTYTAASWETRFAEVKQYKAINGDANVPYRHTLNPPLGRWVHTQRNEYRRMEHGLPSKMTEAKKVKLDRIGFEWTRRGASKENPQEQSSKKKTTRKKKRSAEQKSPVKKKHTSNRTKKVPIRALHKKRRRKALALTKRKERVDKSSEGS